MRAIDTNVLVRVVVRDDLAQVAAAEKFVSAGAWISLITLVEATWVLASNYRLNQSEIANIVGMLLEHDHFVLQEPNTVAAALALFREKPALGFSDCLILQLARRTGHLPLGTFDRKLARLDDVQGL